ncbi:hypothetical protein M231_03193 [Tremella mesenterica]|uniref:Uncharacterized protein n=1 Tax=Tremella mesenterica TaxID=5217 RepID=A0A4Q1BNR6_TREME|nr:hypothetical protein M231_03193 [Tremella mesenterica]
MWSILAGLTPSLILEIAARGMSFWTYQTSQESEFQTLVLKNAQTRLAQLEQQVNTVNGELQIANTRIANLEGELETVNRQKQDLINEVREKDREMNRLRGTYDKMKRRAILGSAAQAADIANGQAQHAGLTTRSPIMRMRLKILNNGNHPQPFVPTPPGGHDSRIPKYVPSNGNKGRSVSNPTCFQATTAPLTNNPSVCAALSRVTLGGLGSERSGSGIGGFGKGKQRQF